MDPTQAAELLRAFQAADIALPTQLSGSTPASDEALTATSAAVTDLDNAPVGAQRAVVEVSVASIRFRLTGASPEWSGHVAHAGDAIHLDHGGEISGFQALAVASDATLFVTYY